MMKKLYEGIKEAIILANDLSVVNDPKIFVNILSDLNCFESCKAFKTIIHVFQTESIIEKIFKYTSVSGSSDFLLFKSNALNRILDEYGFQRELTNYVFDSFAYAFGLSEKPFSPLTEEAPLSKKFIGQWDFLYRDGKKQLISIRPDGIAITQSNTQYNWASESDEINIFIEKVVRYSGKLISDNTIKGTAYSELYNKIWEWSASRKSPIFCFDNLLNTKWTIINETDELENIEIILNDHHILYTDKYGNGSWWLEDNRLILILANSYMRYEIAATLNGVLGKASNRNGISWSFTLKSNNNDK